MPTPDPENITVKDPQDLIYISKKNWARKQNVENNDPLKNLFGRPGPISGLVLTTIDIAVELILKIIFYIWDITQYAFDWINNMTFGNFQGIIPSNYSGGKVISTKFFRYTTTVLLPPLGIMLSKGIFGWFSILCCILITYVHYLAGIIFAFVITSKNRYADQYEAYQIQIFDENPQLNTINDDMSAFILAGGFFFVILFVFILFFHFF